MKAFLLPISILINVILLAAFLFALNKYGGWKNLWAKINNRGIEKTYHHRKNFFEMMPDRDSSIVFFGDSITEYGEWSELFCDSKIVNRGIAGDHCDGLRGRLDEIVRLKPQKIFVMVGVNDLAFHPPEIVALKYNELAAGLLKKMPTTSIYLQSVFPVNNQVSPTAVNNKHIVTLNDAIQKIAKDNSLLFLDTHPLLLDSNGNLDEKYTLDGIHLNGHAYLKWRDFLLPRIKENC